MRLYDFISGDVHKLGRKWPPQCHMKVFESQPHSHAFLPGINEIRNHPSHLVRPPYAVINAHLSASYLRDLIESLLNSGCA